ncbi:hypothetical protein [Persicirhabdus sediminis]|uniref:Uncharacterized protein n=1 Tax=Persicirhabdus sediminis TaxID=454144 RepID=A0A8J7MEE2_9BACT|nr:hypothetical protein [Persicirhabdus sediminis]MBK1791183.1 hypothetical protein [Persicirhabdus sediminis]
MSEVHEIPHEPLAGPKPTNGLLPPIGFHHRDGNYYHESSYSHLWFFGVMVCIAVGVLMAPIEFKADSDILKYVIAGFFVWGGICTLIAYFIRNRFGQVIVINPFRKTLELRSPRTNFKIDLGQIVELQMCYDESPRAGYQLNLAWRDQQDEIQRHCLYMDTSKRLVSRLAKKYVEKLSFDFTDYSKAAK